MKESSILGFIHPCFNFAQLTVGKFKTRVNKHSQIECIVYIVTGRIQNWANSKLVETEVLHERVKLRWGKFCFTVINLPSIQPLFS